MIFASRLPFRAPAQDPRAVVLNLLIHGDSKRAVDQAAEASTLGLSPSSLPARQIAAGS